MARRVAKLSPTIVFMAAPREQWQAQRSRLASLPLRAFQLIRGSLRAKFILVIVALQTVVMGAVPFVMEHHQRNAIIEQARLRALSLGTSLATVSEGYPSRYNFIKLEQADVENRVKALR